MLLTTRGVGSAQDQTAKPRATPTPVKGSSAGGSSTFAGRLYCPVTTYGLFGKFSAQHGKRDDLVGYLLQAAKLLERNPDCIHYIVSTSDEPEAVWVSEVWTDEAAHDASLEPADIQALIQEARPLIANMSDRTKLTVHGGKGLAG